MAAHQNQFQQAQEMILKLFSAATGVQAEVLEVEAGHSKADEPHVARLPASGSTMCRLLQAQGQVLQAEDGKEERTGDLVDYEELSNVAVADGSSTLCSCVHAEQHCRVLQTNGETYGILRFLAANQEQPVNQAIDVVNRASVAIDEAARTQAQEGTAAAASKSAFEAQHLRHLEDLLVDIVQGLNDIQEDERALRFHLEQIKHELATRLQNVIALAENLVTDYYLYGPEGRLKELKRLLNGTLATDTVAQTLGGYLGHYRFRKRSIALLAHEAKGLYEDEARRRGIRIQVGMPTSLHHTGADAHVIEISDIHLQYALNNLVQNAVKYSFKGTAQVPRIVYINGHVEDDMYVLTIENYGVGILPDEIASGAIFREGYQGRLTVQEYRRGSGKGLFFAKRIIDRHHGHIEVESRVDVNVAASVEEHGKPHLNRFSIYLPRTQPTEDVKGAEKSK